MVVVVEDPPGASVCVVGPIDRFFLLRSRDKDDEKSCAVVVPSSSFFSSFVLFVWWWWSWWGMREVVVGIGKRAFLRFPSLFTEEEEEGEGDASHRLSFRLSPPAEGVFWGLFFLVFFFVWCVVFCVFSRTMPWEGAPMAAMAGGERHARVRNDAEDEPVEAYTGDISITGVDDCGVGRRRCERTAPPATATAAAVATRSMGASFVFFFAVVFGVMWAFDVGSG